MACPFHVFAEFADGSGSWLEFNRKAHAVADFAEHIGRPDCVAALILEYEPKGGAFKQAVALFGASESPAFAGYAIHKESNR